MVTDDLFNITYSTQSGNACFQMLYDYFIFLRQTSDSSCCVTVLFFYVIDRVKDAAQPLFF